MRRGLLVPIAALVAGLSLAACATNQASSPSGRFVSPNVPMSPVPVHPSTAAPKPLPGQTRPPSPPTIHGTWPPAGTGITGITVLDPACPVQRAESPCPDRPVPARLTVLNAMTRMFVATVYSAQDGHFKVAVNPGRYLLRVVTVVGIRPHGPTEVVVTVRRGRYTSVTVRIDTGIR